MALVFVDMLPDPRLEVLEWPFASGEWDENAGSPSGADLASGGVRVQRACELPL